jgi:hypothetical protein
MSDENKGRSMFDLIWEIFADSFTGKLTTFGKVFLVVTTFLVLGSVGYFYVWKEKRTPSPGNTTAIPKTDTAIQTAQIPGNRDENTSPKGQQEKRKAIAPPEKITKKVIFSGSVLEEDGSTGIDSVQVIIGDKEVLTRNGQFTIELPIDKDHIPQPRIQYKKKGYITQRTPPVELMFDGKNIKFQASTMLKKAAND